MLLFCVVFIFPDGESEDKEPERKENNRKYNDKWYSQNNENVIVRNNCIC